MANQNTSLLLIFLFISLMATISTAISTCGGSCRTLDDCDGQLICINRRCGDDPDVGTTICSGGGGSSSDECKPSGMFRCGAQSFKVYKCSPPVTSSTAAMLTNNDFSEGGDGGAPSECDERFHKNTERVVALSTGWYAGGSRCGKTVRIRAANGRTTTAKVVDECDSTVGCDAEHAGQPPCKNNIVDGSDAVWTALGLDKDVGIVDVTWSMI